MRREGPGSEQLGLWLAEPRKPRRLGSLWQTVDLIAYQARLPYRLPEPTGRQRRRRRPRRSAGTAKVVQRPFAQPSTDGEIETLHDLGCHLVDDLIDGHPLEHCLLVPVRQVFWGVMTLPHITPEAALEAVVSVYEHHTASGRLAPSSAKEAATVGARLVRYLSVGCRLTNISGTTETQVRGFVFAPKATGLGVEDPTLSTAGHRLWASNKFFRELIALGVMAHNPAEKIVIKRGEGLSARPLTDQEELSGRRHSARNRRDTRGPAGWALGRAMTYSTEATLVEPADLFEDQSLLWLPGGHGRAPRWAHLDDWSIEALIGRIDHLGVRRDERVSLIYEGEGDFDSRQASGSDLLYEIYKRAGYGSNPQVRPSSLAAWSARRLHDQTGDLEEVRRRLGVRTLDRARQLIALPHGQSDLPPLHRREALACR